MASITKKSSDDMNLNVERTSLEIEYRTLRDEIIKRIELRQKLLEMNLVFAGILLGVALNSKNYDLALIYPPIGTLMALAWIQHDNIIKDAATYIRIRLEDKMISSLGWERFRQELRTQSKWPYIILLLSQIGTFILMQFVALLIGFPGGNISEWSPRAEILISIDFISLIVVSLVFIYWSLYGRSNSESEMKLMENIGLI